MTSTDELVSSLSCTEFLADSPSTSTNIAVNGTTSRISICDQRRRSNRIVLQPVNNRRINHGQAVSRKRPSTTDLLRLNSPQRISVLTGQDRFIHLDQRVLENLLFAEEHLKPNYHYFTAVQEHIQPIHREQAVEWILDVSKEEKCDPDVFPLAVSLIDRFLSLQNIFRQDIQVLAGVCLFIASKVKAPQPMNAQKVSYYTADSVKVHDVLSWELLVLAHLNWEISMPTAFDFLDQLNARLPSLQLLRPAFAAVLQKIQRCHKLATMYPSIQCCLSLIFAAERYANRQLRSDVERILADTFQLQINLLRSYFPLMERVVSDGPVLPQPSPVAPPSSCEQRTLSPALISCPPSIPATPHNDSGFCSGVSSPESALKKELECSPPKMSRLTV